MNLELLGMLNPFNGKKNKPRLAMNFIRAEVEKKTGPIQAFDMAVDFESEIIIFEVKEKGIKENIKHPFLFMLIQNMVSAELASGTKLIALIVNYEKEKPFPANYFYVQDGENLSNTKIIEL
jgi:hypothetical protein